MTHQSEQERIERLLVSGEAATPPEGLAEKIKAEIPERFPFRSEEKKLADVTAMAEAREKRSSTPTWWALAASVLLTFSIAYVSVRTVLLSKRERTVAAAESRPAVASDTVAVAGPARTKATSVADEAWNQVAAPPPPAAAPSGKLSAQTGGEMSLPPQERQAAAAEPLEDTDWFDRLEGEESKKNRDARGQVAQEGLYKEDALRRDAKRSRESTELSAAQAPYSVDAVSVIAESPAARVSEPVAPPPPASAGAKLATRPQMKAESDKTATTGGSREPNDEAHGDVYFRDYGVNPFIDTEDDRFSTFGMDVDTGSYAVARKYLREGNLPPAAAIRPEEFINYFQYGDRPPAQADFALYAEGAPSPFTQNDRYRVVRFGIQSRVISAANRKPAVLVFVVDVSGSMAKNNRLTLVKQSLAVVIDELRPSDKVGLVIYGSSARVAVEPTSDHDAFRSALEELSPEGSTNTEAGLKLAYEQIREHREAGSIHKIILCADGVANEGNTSAESILAGVGASDVRGVELTTIGFGMGNYNDVLMEQLANKGNGSYAYVDTLKEAARVLVQDLSGLLQTVASDAKVQVEFDPKVVSRFRLIGYENRHLATEQFRDDSVDAGEIGSGHSVTALYEIKLQPGAGARDRAGAIRIRYRRGDRDGEVQEIGRWIAMTDFARSWETASRALRLAAVAGKLAEVLKDSYWTKALDPMALVREAERLSGEFEGNEKVDQLVKMTRATAKLKPRKPSVKTDDERRYE